MPITAPSRVVTQNREPWMTTQEASFDNEMLELVVALTCSPSGCRR
jgi:hypothetical protein